MTYTNKYGKHQDNNPSSNNSFGFTKNYDGRIRGGIKTLEAFTNPTPIKSGGYSQFNRIGKSNIPKPSPTNPNPSSLVTGTHGCCTEGIACAPTKYCGDDCNCHWKKTDSGKFIPHPLDVLRQPRKKGSRTFDPVSKTWKIDDLRARGWSNGKLLVWGR